MLPDPVPFGPASRYAGLSDVELVGWLVRLTRASDLWWLQVVRFRQVGVTTALGGPCARALVDAQVELVHELSALRVALEMRRDEIRRAVAAAA